MAYANVAQRHVFDRLCDPPLYYEATVQEAIDFATVVIDGYCGLSFEAKPFDVTVDRSGTGRLRVPGCSRAS